MSNTVKVAIVGSVALVLIVALLLRLRYHARGAGRVRAHLRDANPTVRISALHSIGELGLVEFIDELRPLLQTEHDPAVLDALMVEILLSKTSSVSTRKLVELRSWAVERQNRVHGGRLPERNIAPVGTQTPVATVAIPRDEQGPLLTAPVEAPEPLGMEIADVDLWAPTPELPLPVFSVPGVMSDTPGETQHEQLEPQAASNESSSNDHSSSDIELDDELVIVEVAEMPVDLDAASEAAVALSVAMEEAQREAFAIEASARRETEAVARAAEHEAEALATSARFDAENLANEAELVARQLTEAAAAEAAARLEEAHQLVAQMKRDAQIAAAEIRDVAQRDVDLKAALDAVAPEQLLEEAEAEADALIEAARLASMELVERSRQEAEALITEAAAEREELLQSAQSQVATVEHHAATERRALLDATYAQCLALIEQLPIGANLSADDARALLESWRSGAGEGISSAQPSVSVPSENASGVGSDPEHFIVIVKSPREIAKAAAKAEAKAKKKAKKKAKRARERAKARAEKERLAALAERVEDETAARTEAQRAVAVSESVLGVEPVGRLSIPRPNDEEPR